MENLQPQPHQLESNVTSIFKHSPAPEDAAAYMQALTSHPAFRRSELTPELRNKLVYLVAKRVGIDPELVPLPDQFISEQSK